MPLGPGAELLDPLIVSSISSIVGIVGIRWSGILGECDSRYSFVFSSSGVSFRFDQMSPQNDLIISIISVWSVVGGAFSWGRSAVSWGLRCTFAPLTSSKRVTLCGVVDGVVVGGRLLRMESSFRSLSWGFSLSVSVSVRRSVM